MASVIPFPTVAAHRRLPHLQNNQKEAPPKHPHPQEASTQTNSTNDQSQSSHTQKAILASQDQDPTTGQLALPATDHHKLLKNGPQDGSHPKTLKTVKDSSASPLGTERGHALTPRDPEPMRIPSQLSSPASAHDSRMIKSALYDAFGVLYHPVQHTHHPSSTGKQSLSPSPLLGRSPRVSPRASPMLLPHLVSSAPITPLLLEEGSSSGYFGLQTTSATSPTVGPSTGTSRHGHHSRHHHHTSSHLSATYTSQEQGYISPKVLSRRSSIDFSLDPAQHPVLSSLQSLSIVHPAEHYHPHLGHDLGHDRVDLTSPVSATPPISLRDDHSEPVGLGLSHPQARTLTSSQAQLGPSASLEKNAPRVTPVANSTSPFPMDRDLGDPLANMNHGQGLV